MNVFSFTGWRKSSYSNSSANCVEVAMGATGRAGGAGPGGSAPLVGVRDSKQKGSGPVLVFSAADWQRFLARAKAGDLGT